MKNFIIAAALVASTSAQAGFYTGAGFMGLHTNSQTAYIVGVYDTMQNNMFGYTEKTTCIPTGITAGVLTDVVVEHIRTVPERWNDSARR